MMTPVAETFYTYKEHNIESKNYFILDILRVYKKEKDGENQLDLSCEKLRSITSSQGAEEYPA